MNKKEKLIALIAGWETLRNSSRIASAEERMSIHTVDIERHRREHWELRNKAANMFKEIEQIINEL